MKKWVLSWDSEFPQSAATLEEIDHFNARGMRRVYGRGDTFPERRTFNMDIWKDKHDRLVMRFWSRNIDVDWESYEIMGLDACSIPTLVSKSELVDSWVPKAVRNAYEDWIQCW